MAERRNIVVLGAGSAGLQSAHYILQHILPQLKKKEDIPYHVYLINPSAEWYFRYASPRVASSEKRMSSESVLFKLNEGFKQYPTEDITLVEAAATGLNKENRTVTYKRSQATQDEVLPYHALIIATGSKTFYQAFSMSGPTQITLDALKVTNEKVDSAKDIVIVGGGATAVEFAGEVAEHRNGKPAWFSSPERKVKIQLYTSADRLLPSLRPAISETAEQKLKALGVEIVYQTKVIDAKETPDGRTAISLANGNQVEADLYVPAYGVQPNSSWLPAELLDKNGFLVNNHETLRVDAAGPRVYAVGDVASYSRNNIWDILSALPVLATNLKRDLLSYDAKSPDGKPKGKDRVHKPETRESMIVPIGSGGGVGAIMGWRLPSFFIWALKGRDYMVGMSGWSTVAGGSVKKETKWTAEEAAV